MNDTTPIHYFTGLDLGQAQDFTAIAVLEKSTAPAPETSDQKLCRYAVRHLVRFALGTSFTEVCSQLAQLFDKPPLRDSTLAVDQTAVGRPVLDMLRWSKINASIQPVTITAGYKATQDEQGGWLVPKKELVSTLQVLLQSRRIQVAPSLPEAETLVQELTTFQAKTTPAASAAIGAWREGPHDDLVFAVAVAAWKGEHWREFRWW